MPIIEITSLDQPGVDVYGTLTEAQLRNRLEPDKGIFIAESPKVIHVALDAGYEPLSLLCERRHITGDAAGIIERCVISANAGFPWLFGSRAGRCHRCSGDAPQRGQPR